MSIFYRPLSIGSALQAPSEHSLSAADSVEAGTSSTLTAVARETAWRVSREGSVAAKSPKRCELQVRPDLCLCLSPATLRRGISGRWWNLYLPHPETRQALNAELARLGP